MCTCQINNSQSHVRYLSLSQQQSRNYSNTLKKKKKKSFIPLVAWIPMMKMKMSLTLSLESASRSTGTNSSSESVMFSSEPLSGKKIQIRTLIQYYSFPCRVTHVRSARRHFETYNFRQCDTRVINAKKDKRILDQTKRDYRNCCSLCNIIETNN